MNHDQLLEIGTKKRNKEISESWNELAQQYGGGSFKDGEAFRTWTKDRLRRKDKPCDTPSPSLNKESFKETVEIHRDGTQSSVKLIEMSLEDSKSPEYLLRAHGYDTNAWELISARSNVWNAFSKQTGIITLYSSKISVKPKSANKTSSIERLINSFDKIVPFELSPNSIQNIDPKLLEIPLFDMHWGISDTEHYRDTYSKISEKIKCRMWKEILIVIGQDNFHNDNHKGTTSNGTMIESVDMEQAWEQSSSFYVGLIKDALAHSNNIKILFSKGNHDETLSWAFVKYLKAKFPNVEVDDSFIERKIHAFGDNFIGITHGDKGRKNLHNIFPVEFPLEWANAKNREIHTGHFHVEDGKDVFGTMVRTLSTKNKTDEWHKNNGFVGSHKRFMLFEYSMSELESIHYV